MTRGNILLRVDGSFKLGWGHVFRCIGLAQELIARGYMPIFLSKPNAELKKILASYNFNFLPLSDKIVLGLTLQYIKQFESQTVVLDLANAETLSHLASYKQYVEELKKNGISVVAFDGMAEEGITNKIEVPHDLTIVPYVGVKRLDYQVNKTTRYLFGPSYYVFRDEILTLAKSKILIKQGKHLLIMLGGGEAGQILKKILIALRSLSFPDVTIKMITYSLNQRLTKLATELNVDIMPLSWDPTPMLMWADTAVIGSGLTKYEMAYLGVPCLSFATLRKHEKLMRRFAAKKSIIYLGYAEDVTVVSIISSLREILFDKRMRTSLHKNSKILIDGKGRERLLSKLTSLRLL